MAESLRYAIERLGAILDDVLPVATEHWNETEDYRIKFARIRSMDERTHDDKMGLLVFATARTEAGRLVGYSAFRIVPASKHSPVMGRQDVLYVLPEFRHGYNSIHLFKTAEREVVRQGIRKICLNAPADKASFWERLGYEESTRSYTKIFDEEAAKKVIGDPQ